MIKKYWLIIVIFSVLILGILYWYFSYQLPKPTATPNVEKTSGTEETMETEETEGEGIKSIPLEKPPFLKD